MTDAAARFRGSLLGLAVGDGLGARFEGQPASAIRARFPSPEALARNPPVETLHYTDDTQMAIAVAEALAHIERPTEADYARAFVANYEPWRGYGRGARATIEAIASGVEPAVAATSYFPEGSFGNGAAMRVAPVGLRFCDDLAALVEQARTQSLPTHRHPLGIEGAIVLARAVAWAVRATRFDRDAFFDASVAAATTADFRDRLERARHARTEDAIAALGNGIAALDSVPTALALFATWPDSFQDAVGNAVLLGGDCDTIAAMTGALSGAMLGEAAIPESWLSRLPDGPGTKGRQHFASLAGSLHRAD